MSCELKKIFDFEKYDSLINQVFVPQATVTDWSLTTDLFDISPTVSQGNKKIETSENVPNREMIDDCFLAISSISHLLAFAYRDKVCIYNFKDQFYPQFQFGGVLDEMDEDETITAICCLPFVSLQVSNQGRPDWTCIILGFNSGMIRIYTENMSLLLEQKVCDEPITSIKVRSFHSPYLNGRTLQINALENADEIIFCLKSLVVICEGYAFFQTLRSCRNNLARTSSYRFPLRASASEFSLPLKKYSFPNSQQVQDCDSCGIHEVSFYDKLTFQSLTRGPYGHPKSKSISGHFFISSGQDPFIGIHRAEDAESGSVLDELSHAVINKVKNMIPLFGRSTERENSKIELPIDFVYNFGLYDQHRLGGKVCLSPNRELAAICDEFGRVCLVSICDRIVVRMWKGYRDAQCGWIESFENPNEFNSKRALFLAIYTPKRGILEIWLCQQGPRVGAFNVGKMCKLVYANHSLLGLNRFLLDQLRSLPSQMSYSPFICYLFDFKTGSLFSVQVPFLCALTEKHSREAREMLILKELQNITKNPQDSHLTMIESIRNPEVKWKAINILISNSNISLLKLITANIVNNISIDFNEKLETGLYNLAQNSYRVLKLCELYEYLHLTNFKTSPILVTRTLHSNPPDDLECGADKLKWKGNDFARCISLFSFAESLIIEEDSYIEASELTLKEFIDFFAIVDSSTSVRCSNFNQVCDSFIYLKKSDSSYNMDDFVKLGKFIFIPSLVCDNLENLLIHLEESRIEHSLILFSIFAYWLQSNLSHNWTYWIKFFTLVENVVNLMKSSKKSIIHRDNDFLSFIKHLSHIICLSTHVDSAMVAAFILKTIYFDLDKTLSRFKLDSSSRKELEYENSDEWEDLSIERENVCHLITQIEHTFILDTVLKTSREHLSKNISLHFLLSNNSGIVSELIAEWIVLYPISASVILATEDFHDEEEDESGHNKTGIDFGIDVFQTSTGSKLDEETLKQLIRHLKRCFPHSLEGEVILVNCAWESLVQWNKDPLVKTSCFLHSSLNYLLNISNSFLRHNLGCLMWKIFVVKRFETLALLIEKMSKTPKDRICKKELGMGEEVVDLFVKFAVDLLDLLLESVGMAEREGLPLFRVDDWWRNQNASTSSSSSRLPLVHLAIQQSPGNPDLLLELHHLSLVLYLIVNFQMKNSKPLSLFSTDVKMCIFKAVQTKLPSHTKEVHILEKRLSFLFNAITLIAQSVPSRVKSKDDLDITSKLQLNANQWFGKIILLGREWDLSLDELRKKYLYELYKNGSDTLATDMILAIQDRADFGEKLLNIAGLRILNLIEKDKADYVSLMSPNVFHWLESLKKNNEVPEEVDLKNTSIMMEYIITFIPESNKSLLRIANSLYTILKTLSSK